MLDLYVASVLMMRIVSGQFGGRRLVAPKDDATRPTSEKVREAIFASLGVISNARVLDLYAGTGGLGLEAMSRGASRAVFVESRRAALVALRSNIASLGLSGAVAVLEKAVERSRSVVVPLAPFDLVFADPPYAAIDSGEVVRSLASLFDAEILAPDCSLVLEHASRSEAPTVAGFVRDRTRKYGDTSVSFYDRAAVRAAV